MQTSQQPQLEYITTMASLTDCAATYFLLFMLALPQTQYNYVNNFSHSGKKNWGLLGKKKSPMFDVAIYALVTCIYIVR